VQSNFITQLLNLKGIKVTKISHGNSFVKIYITTEPRKHTCPACGSKTSRIHDYREQTIKDLPLQFKHTYLVLRKRLLFVFLIILIMVLLHYLRFSVLMSLRVMQRLESINVFLLMAKRKMERD
jgi:hypothetical protein